MTNSLAIAVSILALSVSAMTAWLTLLRKGTVKMTRPTVIFFGPDTPRRQDEPHLPKVYLRMLLFSTSKRGRVIENMHVSLTRNEFHQSFNIWAYGDHKLVRGSGLFIGETGVSANHHFLTSKEENSFQFLPGTYQLKVFALLLGDPRHKLLFQQELEISIEIAELLSVKGTGLYFDWEPDSSRYVRHAEPSPIAANLSN